MNKASVLAITVAAFGAGAAFAAQVHDSIHDMERARKLNHYDMAGHGAKAESLLRETERELHDAVEAAKAAK